MGKKGQWSLIEFEVEFEAYFCVRRLLKNYLVSEAKSNNQIKRVIYLKNYLKKFSPHLSKNIGLSSFCPISVTLKLVNFCDCSVN